MLRLKVVHVSKKAPAEISHFQLSPTSDQGQFRKLEGCPSFSCTGLWPLGPHILYITNMENEYVASFFNSRNFIHSMSCEFPILLAKKSIIIFRRMQFILVGIWVWWQYVLPSQYINTDNNMADIVTGYHIVTECGVLSVRTTHRIRNAVMKQNIRSLKCNDNCITMILITTIHSMIVMLIVTWTSRWVWFNSLPHGRFEWQFWYVIFKLILFIDGCGVSCEIVLRWRSMDNITCLPLWDTWLIEASFDRIIKPTGCNRSFVVAQTPHGYFTISNGII